MLPLVKIHRYPTGVYIQKKTTLVCKINFTMMIQVCVQVIIKQKSKGDESRLYFHDPLCPRSVTRIHQPSFFLRYKKRFTRHEHRPLRNDILSCDIPTHCLRHIPYSSSCEQVSAANSRSYNSPIFLHRFPMRIGWIIENRDVEFWTPRMDRFLFLLHLSGKVFVLSGSMWRSGGGTFEEETAIIESRGVEYLHATPLRFDITRDCAMRFAVNLKEEFMYRRNFTVLSV